MGNGLAVGLETCLQASLPSKAAWTNQGLFVYAWYEDLSNLDIAVSIGPNLYQCESTARR